MELLENFNNEGLKHLLLKHEGKVMSIQIVNFSNNFLNSKNLGAYSVTKDIINSLIVSQMSRKVEIFSY